MTTVQTLPSLECPKCGKNTVVKKNNDLYQCISCDFYRELKDPLEKDKKDKKGKKEKSGDQDKGDAENGKSGFLLIITAGLVILMIL